MKSAIGLIMKYVNIGAKNQNIIKVPAIPIINVNNTIGIPSNNNGKLINPKRINEPIIATGNRSNNTGATASNNIIPGITENAKVTKMCTNNAKLLSVIRAVPQSPANIQIKSTMI